MASNLNREDGGDDGAGAGVQFGAERSVDWERKLDEQEIQQSRAYVANQYRMAVEASNAAARRADEAGRLYESNRIHSLSARWRDAYEEAKFLEGKARYWESIADEARRSILGPGGAFSTNDTTPVAYNNNTAASRTPQVERRARTQSQVASTPRRLRVMEQPVTPEDIANRLLFPSPSTAESEIETNDVSTQRPRRRLRVPQEEEQENMSAVGKVSLADRRGKGRVTDIRRTFRETKPSAPEYHEPNTRSDQVQRELSLWQRAQDGIMQQLEHARSELEEFNQDPSYFRGRTDPDELRAIELRLNRNLDNQIRLSDNASHMVRNLEEEF